MENYCFVLRHGERADNSLYEGEQARIENMHDPPLTIHGVQQAVETGKMLAKLLAEKNLEMVVVESSPFLRSLETAAAVAKELGVE